MSSAERLEASADGPCARAIRASTVSSSAILPAQRQGHELAPVRARRRNSGTGCVDRGLVGLAEIVERAQALPARSSPVAQCEGVEAALLQQQQLVAQRLRRSRAARPCSRSARAAGARSNSRGRRRISGTSPRSAQAGRGRRPALRSRRRFQPDAEPARARTQRSRCACHSASGTITSPAAGTSGSWRSGPGSSGRQLSAAIRRCLIRVAHRRTFLKGSAPMRCTTSMKRSASLSRCSR